MAVSLLPWFMVVHSVCSLALGVYWRFWPALFVSLLSGAVAYEMFRCERGGGTPS
jgi:hypothetical protein